MPVTPIVLALSMLTTSLPQEIPASRFDHARVTPSPLFDPAPEAISPPRTVAVAALPRSPADGASEGLTWKQIAHRLGGALVGGWLGYFGAQVVRSDWDKDTNGTFQAQRYSWAAAGAVVGLLGSQLISTSGSPNRRTKAAPEAPRTTTIIAAEEIREADARSAWELIYNRRPHWLITRGQNSVAESARGETRDDVVHVTPGREKIIVYVDDVRIGGVEEMHEISADILTSARFLDVREATMRYGGGHGHGAILLSTGVSR